MKYLVLGLVLLTGCIAKPCTEIRIIGDDVLKARQGYYIEFEPIEKGEIE